MPVPVQTILDENTTPSSRVQKDLEIRILQHLEKQEDQGYDIRAVRAAIQSTDTEEARTLLCQFMEGHRDELLASPRGGMKGNYCRNLLSEG